MLRFLLLLSLLFGAAGFGAGLANDNPPTDIMSGDGTPAPPPRGD